MEKAIFAGIDCLVKQGDPDLGCLIILHGYGASSSDLAPLADSMDLDADYTWIFPNGILGLDSIGMYGARAWFPIDAEALEKAAMSGTHRDLSSARPEGMDEAHDRLMELVEDVQDLYPWVILGGFSQGAMMAVDLGVQMTQKPAGLVIFSGTLVNKELWAEKAKRLAGVKFFQSHGSADPLLSMGAADKLRNLLSSSGLQGKYVPFQGGHEIPPQVLKAAEEQVRVMAAEAGKGLG